MRILKKMTAFAWSLRREFAKYAVIGVCSLVLDYSIFLLLYTAFNLWYLFSSATSQLLGGVFNFTMNRVWSFRTQGGGARGQFARYVSLQVFNYAFGIIALYILVDYLHFIPQLGKILTIAMMVCWNFFLYKFFVYR